MALADIIHNQQVSDFLLDPGVYDILDKIAAAHGLPVERSEEFLDLTEAILDEQIHYTQMPQILAQAFGVEQAVSEKIAADIAGYRLLPFEHYLPGLQAQIVSWGGEIAQYPKLRIEQEKISALQLAERLLVRLVLDLPEPLKKRIAFLLEEFMKGKLDEAGLRVFLSRSQKVGGLGLNGAQLEALQAAILKERNTVTLVDPDVLKKVVSSPLVHEAPATQKSETPQQPPEPEIKQEIAVAQSHELAAQVPVVNKPETVEAQPAARKVMRPVAQPVPDIDPNEMKMPLKKAVQVRKQTAPVRDALEAAVALATEQARGVLKAKKVSEKVFADVASKAIRGLRDIYQTRDLIERDWALKGGDLAAVMSAVAEGVSSYQAAAPKSEPETASTNPAPAAAKVSDDLEARFSSLTAGPDKDATPSKARAQLTVGSVPLSTPDGQRKVVDIVSANRLAGPIEQLGKMTPTEFRRLASDPSEAAQKVDDLLSALQATSYEERVKGVLAWRESPMNQLYLQMTEEALAQGLALPEVSSRRRAAGKESLSPGEMKALALLNAKIRF
jgi:hypothetical protein